MSSEKLQFFRLLTTALFIFITPISLAENDRGVRQGSPGGGAPFLKLTPIELELFNEGGVQRAIQLEPACDDCADPTIGSFTEPTQANFVTLTNSAGLGARLNGD